MDINCVSDCAYQIEGKCSLTELAPKHAVTPPMGAFDKGCLYFAKKV